MLIPASYIVLHGSISLVCVEYLDRNLREGCGKATFIEQC